MKRQKLNLLLIVIFYIISPVSVFNFYIIWLVFSIFLIKSRITEVLEKPKCQISLLSIMGIRVQCHPNISKQTMLLDDVDVSPPHEGMNNISNVK